MSRIPCVFLSLLAVTIPSAATGQEVRGVELALKVGGVSESWVRRSGLDGDWLGLSRGVTLGAGIVVPVLHPQLAVHASLSGNIGSNLLERTFVGTPACVGRCESGYAVRDLGTSAFSFTASLAAVVKVMSLGPADLFVHGGVATRRTGFGYDRREKSSGLSGMSWGWISALSVERSFGRVTAGVELSNFSEYRQPSSDPRIMGDLRLGAWADEKLSLTIRVPFPFGGG